MSEDFLHHIWKFRLFDQLNLQTTDAVPVEIIHPGQHNTDSGPDFFNARIRVGDTVWAGNVEVHITASDWNRHGHQKDPAYQNIILHVVFAADKAILRDTGEQVPTLVIGPRVSQKMYTNYLHFKVSGDWIPCARQIADVAPIHFDSALDRVLVERLERKSGQILQCLRLNHNNWEETLYQQLARSFGFRTNASPFELLARSLPSLCIARHRSSLLQVEALLFGQAGLLETDLHDAYPRALQNEYVYLKKKFSLQPVQSHLWKFHRLRPVNFPTIRIAQFAALLSGASNLFSKIMDCEDLKALRVLFMVEASSYWDSHYSFDRSSPQRKKSFGESAFLNVLINTVVPFLFVYGKEKADDQYCSRALRFLTELPAESNAILAEWEALGCRHETAYESQALLELKNEYCSKRRCLSCNVGTYLLKNS
jgi:hypothetical protein